MNVKDKLCFKVYSKIYDHCLSSSPPHILKIPDDFVSSKIQNLATPRSHTIQLAHCCFSPILPKYYDLCFINKKNCSYNVSFIIQTVFQILQERANIVTSFIFILGYNFDASVFLSTVAKLFLSLLMLSASKG